MAKFAAGVVDTGGKFAAGIVDTGGNLPPVSLTPVAHLPPVSLTPVVHLDLQISPRIFEKIRNDPNVESPHQGNPPPHNTPCTSQRIRGYESADHPYS